VRAPDLTPNQLTILAVVVDHEGAATVRILHEALPKPVDFLGLIGDLEVMLERGLVVRRDGEGAYYYASTLDGLLLLRAWLHPAGQTMEARA
jgi:Fe2+ or Zn2+ uptake regulation protein